MMRKKRFRFLSVLLSVLMFLFPCATALADEVGTWTTKASMIPRVYHETAVVNDKIYAIGGRNPAGYLNSVEEYDPSTNTWTTKASMASSRIKFKTAVLNGKIYVIGGEGSPDARVVEEYDPTTNVWTTKAMSPLRYDHQVAVVDGKIYLIGGCDTTSSAVNTVQEYDPITDTWTTKASMNNARCLFEIAVIDGKIFVIGGNGDGYLKSVEEYNPETNVWTTKASMATARVSFGCAVVNGKIYAIGGNNPGYNTVEEYDVSTNTWTNKAPMTQARGFHQVVVVDDKILAIGGLHYTTALTSVEEYDPSTNIWTTKASLTTGRYDHKLAIVNGGIFALGGHITGDYTTGTVEKYTFSIPAPSIPTTLTATAGNAQVALSWTAVSSATGYKVYRSTTAGGPYTEIGTATVTDYTDATVTNGTTYYYVVTATNADGESGYSNEASATPQAPAPSAPTTLTATAGNVQVALSWTAVTGATGYKVYRSTTAGGPYTEIGTATVTDYTDTTVTNGTTYYYVVTATNADGESAYSNEASATPQAPAVTGRALLAITMVSGEVKEYDLTMAEVSAFISWFNGEGGDDMYYMFEKEYNKGPFASRKDYLVSDKIQDFEVMSYE